MNSPTDLLMDLPIKDIVPNPHQPRTVFDTDKLTELANSIKANDYKLIQPVIVENNGDGTYTLVAGERRLRACEMLKLSTIPSIVRAKSNHGGLEMTIQAIVENVQRVDMNPVDEGEAYVSLRKKYELTWIEISLKTGVNVSLVYQRVQLTKLNSEIKKLIRQGKLSHDQRLVKALLLIPKDADRITLANAAAENKMSITQTLQAATKLTSILSTQKMDLGKYKSPAMKLAASHSYDDIDDDCAPSGWNALQQVGKVPPWINLTSRVAKTCKACTLCSMASVETCAEDVCPLSGFLSGMIEDAK